MTEIKPQFLDEESYAAKFDRQFPRDILTEGIVATGDLEVTELDTPGMGVKAASGAGFVQGDQATTQGHYRIFNDASKNLSIAASDPTNPRKDRIIAQVYDSIDIGGIEDKWVLEVLTGTPAASPVVPALPDDALDLAIVLVGANVTTIVNANITDQRTQIALQNVAGNGAGVGDGWVVVGDTWTYASPTTITVPSGAGSIYQIGDKIKLTQTTVKYFYISIVTDTLLTVNGIGLYTLVDAAIISPHYSHIANPVGFPIKMIPGNVKARAYLNAIQENIPSGTATKVLLDTEDYDVGADFASYKFIAPVSGYYLIRATITFTGVVTDKRYNVLIYINGVNTSANISHSSLAEFVASTISDILYINATDYIELYAIQHSGVNTVDIVAGITNTNLAIHLLSV